MELMVDFECGRSVGTVDERWLSMVQATAQFVDTLH